MRRVTIDDIAKHAGLSVATAERVINDRGNFSDADRDKVTTAAKALGYAGLSAPISASSRSRLNFEFFIPVRSSAFILSLTEAIQKAPLAFVDVDISVQVRPTPFGDGTDIINALDALNPENIDGVAVFSADFPSVQQAIDRTMKRGIAVVTLVSNVSSGCHRFVGIDNMSAGRIAGSLLGRFATGKTGKIALVLGAMSVRDQVERHLGFCQVIKRVNPTLELLPPFEGKSSNNANRNYLSKLLAERDDVVGLYSMAAGNTGLLEALNGIDRANRPITVVHDLSPDVKKALVREEIDAVIGQDVDHISRSAMRILKAIREKAMIIESQEKIRIDIYLSHSI